MATSPRFLIRQKRLLMPILLKSDEEIDTIAEAGKIIIKVFDVIDEIVEVGKTTERIGQEIKDLILQSGGRPAFLGYRGFPGPACISINDEIVHGIPGGRKLVDGDLVKIDVGVELQGYYADAARTLLIGKNEKAQMLLDATRKSLDVGINAIRLGCHISDISNAIEKFIEKEGYSVVRDLTGHGIGSSLHEDPPIPNFGKPGLGPEIEPGMVLAVEPMVNGGSCDTVVDQNGWTVLTKDRSLSAHFEDTVAVTGKGVRILTRRLSG